jgi:hypothetical protein
MNKAQTVNVLNPLDDVNHLFSAISVQRSRGQGAHNAQKAIGSD